MAYPTPVGGRVTDAVTQTNVATLAAAPAMAAGAIAQSAAHAVGILVQNMAQAQRQAAICGQAATSCSVASMYFGNRTKG